MPAPLTIDCLPLTHINNVNMTNPADRPNRVSRVPLTSTTQCILEALFAEIRSPFADTDAVDMAYAAERTCE